MTDFPSKQIRTNGITLNVIDVGEGEPVLLVHGFPDTHQVWRKQIPALLEAGYRVIAPDTRGCGDSDLPTQVKDYKLPVLVADLVGLLDALELDTVKLIGHDWGAVMAWQLALSHPERISQYIALSVGHPDAYARDGIAQKLKGWYVLFFQLRGLAEMLLTARQWWLFRKLINYAAEWPHLYPMLSRPGRLTAGINYYRANWLKLVLGRNFPRCQVPVIGIHSDGDRYLTEAQMRNSHKYCDAGFSFWPAPGAGHWLQLEQPERINALLLQALTNGAQPSGDDK